jgi:hypothetical protein
VSGTDSAGVPWEGRSFHENPGAGDDGSADPRLLEALQRFRARELDAPEVVDALRDARLLAPLIAVRGDEGVGEHGRLVDKTQELSIVTVTAPDGRAVLPAFTSVAALAAWDPSARPIPVDARRVALAAAGEGTDLVIVDPTSATEFGIRRPALKALALGEAWVPSWVDVAVADAFAETAGPEREVRAIELRAGDPDARFSGPELVVELTLVAGLGRAELDALLARLQARWSIDPTIADRVDSMALRVR